MALVKVVLFTVIPSPENETDAPETKSEPPTVTFWLLAPRGRESGSAEETVGAGEAVTRKHPLQEPARPSGLVTVTSRAVVGASGATVRFARRAVLLTNVVLFTLMPVPEKERAAPEAKPVPLTVTSLPVVPRGKELGSVEETVGSGAVVAVVTVKQLQEPA